MEIPLRRGAPVRLGRARDRPAARGARGRLGARRATRSRSSSPAIAWCARTATSASTAPAVRRPSARCSRSEGVDADELERLAGRGIRYIGRDTTGIFCYPVVPARAADHDAPPGHVPLRRGRPGGRLPRLQGLPAARGRRRSRPELGRADLAWDAPRPPTRWGSANGTRPAAAPRGAGGRCPRGDGRPRRAATGTARSRRSGS